jgi:hypothetical protein
MQKPEIAHAPSHIGNETAEDDLPADLCASLLELIPSDEPALIVGRRNAAAMLADILVASEDMSS